MERHVKNRYVYDLSDKRGAEIAIRNLRIYLTELNGERAKLYARRMAEEGERYATALLQSETLGKSKTVDPRKNKMYKELFPKSEKQSARHEIVTWKYPDGSIGTKHLPLDVAAGASGITNTHKGRTSVFVKLMGRDATFVEFGTGVALNGEEHPYKAKTGLSPLGGYGEGRGANPNGWFFNKEGDKAYHTYGIPQARILYRTSEHLKNISSSVARAAFKMKP